MSSSVSLLLCLWNKLLWFIPCTDGVSLMYQRVQKVEYSSPRPVLILGPLVEACKDMLEKEAPTKFCRCLPGELLICVNLYMKDVCVHQTCVIAQGRFHWELPNINSKIRELDVYIKIKNVAFFSLLLEIMKASQQAIERGVKDCVFIDYKRRSGHFDVTTVASIKEITEKVNLK